DSHGQVPRRRGSVTKRWLASTASKAHGRSSWRGMDGECAQRLLLVKDSATALLHVSCTHRCSHQRCTATFLVRFHHQIVHALRLGKAHIPPNLVVESRKPS